MVASAATVSPATAAQEADEWHPSHQKTAFRSPFHEDIAAIALEQSRGDKPVVGLGVAEEDVVPLRHHHPEMVAPALFLGEHQDAG
jgi:hypothetical protein